MKDQDGNDVLDLPCHIHTKKDEEGNLIYPKHTTRQCRLLIQQFREKQPKEKEKEPDKDEDKQEDDDGVPNVNSTLMIFADVESKKLIESYQQRSEDGCSDNTQSSELVPDCHRVRPV